MLWVSSISDGSAFRSDFVLFFFSGAMFCCFFFFLLVHSAFAESFCVNKKDLQKHARLGAEIRALQSGAFPQRWVFGVPEITPSTGTCGWKTI